MTEEQVNDNISTTIDTSNMSQTTKPPMYNVVLYNDDYTPADFVAYLLQTLFGFSSEKALNITMDVHEKGKGIAGTFPYDIAETKVVQINENAKSNGHPLMSDLEEAEDQ